MYRHHANIWPAGFERIPSDALWALGAIDDSARAYDAVKHHTWYRNLEPTLEDLARHARDGDIVVDYSGGTGIFSEQFLNRNPDREVGLLLVDASAKFLRLAVEKFRDDDRTAFRHLRYVKDQKRLLQLDEVVPVELRERKFDGLCCTNAVHLYPELEPTFKAWAGLIRSGGFALVQSGNIDNPDAPQDSWFIDRTVECIQPIARELVTSDPDYAVFNERLDDEERNAAHDKLRHAYFLPIRPLSFYVEALGEAGFEIETVGVQTVDAKVSEWTDFLCAYHEGILGWAGGCKRVDGADPLADVVALRKRLLGASLSKLFNDRPAFQACWTHIRCSKP